MIDVRTDRLITVAEAAKLLRKSPGTIYRYIRREDLEAVRVGGELFTTEEACQRLLAPTSCRYSDPPLTERDKRELARHGIHLG